MTDKTGVSRRRFIANTAALSAVAIAAPYVRRANAAGKLSIGLWDHWVPGANEATRKLVEEWAEKEKVAVQMDFITRSEEHTSELQSLMRNSYAVFCLKKKHKN